MQNIVWGYQQAGVSAVSVLTDQAFFSGLPTDLQNAREWLTIPILRKDFIIDSYQVAEAKAWGADLILLIAACLDSTQLRELAQYAHSLGLEVLMEVHDRAELERSPTDFVDLVGVNNRNLKTFQVDVQTSLDLAPHIPKHLIKVTESGLRQVETLFQLREAGYQGFLIGESFMKTDDPGSTCAELTRQLTQSGKMLSNA